VSESLKKMVDGKLTRCSTERVWTLADDSLLVRHRSLFLGLIGALLFVPFLGGFDFWYPDEPDIAQVCQAMYESGDWISPRRNGVIWVDYPPFLYWAGCATAWVLGGVSEFSLRLPSALGAILMVLAVCRSASRWFGPRAGLWSGLLLLTFLQYAYNAVSYRTDMLFVLGIGAGLLLYAEGAGEARRWLPRVLGFALLGFGMLVKGPLGLLLPGLVLTLWHASRKEWRLLLELAPLSLISLVIYLPWAAAVAAAMGKDNLVHELYAQNVQRFLSGSRGHEKPWHYFFNRIWVDLIPWSPLLPFSLWWVHKQKLWKDSKVQLLLWWFGAFFVFLSIATTKRQVYLLPAYPALAILMGWWISSLANSESESPQAPDPRPARVLGIFFAGLLLLLGVAGLVGGLGLDSILGRLDLARLERETIQGMRWSIVVAGCLFLVLGFWLWKARQAHAQVQMERIAAVTLPIYILAFAFLLPGFNPLKTYAPQGRWLRSQIGNSQQVGLLNPDLGFHKQGAFGYAINGLVKLVENESDMEAFFTNHPNSVVLVLTKSSDPILSSTKHDWSSTLIRDFTGKHATEIAPFTEPHDPKRAAIAAALPLLRAGRHRYYVFRAPR
jgi:4-amino-4-deoxy-L-arabinose transferase-like glycosyltransferase